MGTVLSAVRKLPVNSLGASIVGMDVVLACGRKVLATIGNVEVENARLTEHFVTLSFHREDGEVFHLARYHDPDYAQRGPRQLATFLGLKKKDVFPMAWDVSAFAGGLDDALRGVVTEVPRERLTRAEIIALAVP